MSETAVPTLDELAAAPERAGDLPVQIVAALLVKLVGIQTTLLGRLIVGSASESTTRSPGILLTIEEVAKRLDIEKDFAYELARRGELPVIRVGKKYLRVAPAALEKCLSQWRVDGGLSMQYSRRRKRGRGDRRGTTSDSEAIRMDAGPTG